MESGYMNCEICGVRYFHADNVQACRQRHKDNEDVFDPVSASTSTDETTKTSGEKLTDDDALYHLLGMPEYNLQGAELQALSWLHQRQEPYDPFYYPRSPKSSYVNFATGSIGGVVSNMVGIVGGAMVGIDSSQHILSLDQIYSSRLSKPGPISERVSRRDHAGSNHSMERCSIASPHSYATADSAFESFQTAPSIATSGSQKVPYYRSTQRDPKLDRVAIKDAALSIMSNIPGSGLSQPAFLRHLEQQLYQKILSSPLYINDDTETEAQQALADDMHAYIVAYLGAACNLEIGEELRHEIRSHLSVLATKQNERRRAEQGVANSSLEDFTVFDSAWLEHLESKGILLGPDDELNWSGQGQHVEYKPAEEGKIPLKPERLLGHSASAVVESVMCRRIRLARKKIQCSRRLSKEDAIDEVRHLQHIQHSHVVRVVGTYTITRYLAILLYPAAQWNLEEFMEDTGEIVRWQRDLALSTFLWCLTNTISFLHANYVKHMDIKPKNILIRQTATSNSYRSCYKVYLADFGIARAYQSTVEAETDSPTSYTRTYAAPEVVRQESRGFGADIFSLGCVFIEMVAAILSLDKNLQNIRCNAHGDTSYHANIEAVCNWYESGPRQELNSCDPRLQLPPGLFLDALSRMLYEQADSRPSAHSLASYVIGIGGCFSCFSGPEPFEAAQPISE